MKKEMGWSHKTYGGGEVQRGFCWENLRERDDLRPMCGWEDNIKNGSSGSGMGAWTGVLTQKRDRW
jgi:hypothetical protein